MLLAASFLRSSITRDRRGQEASSEQQEARISKAQLEDDVSLIQIFIFNS